MGKQAEQFNSEIIIGTKMQFHNQLTVFTN